MWCVHTHTHTHTPIPLSIKKVTSVAVVQASSCSSDLIPSLGTSIRHRYGPKKQKKKKKKRKKTNKQTNKQKKTERERDEDEILPYVTTLMDLEGIMLSEISQRTTNTI